MVETMQTACEDSKELCLLPVPLFFHLICKLFLNLVLCPDCIPCCRIGATASGCIHCSFLFLYCQLPIPVLHKKKHSLEKAGETSTVSPASQSPWRRQWLSASQSNNDRQSESGQTGRCNKLLLLDHPATSESGGIRREWATGEPKWAVCCYGNKVCDVHFPTDSTSGSTLLIQNWPQAEIRILDMAFWVLINYLYI